MKANLIDGKLVPPTSVVSGQTRCQQLDYEIAKLKIQIDAADPDKRKDKVGALGWLWTERKQLAAWLAERGAETLPPRANGRVEKAPVEEVEDFAAFWNEE